MYSTICNSFMMHDNSQLLSHVMQFHQNTEQCLGVHASPALSLEILDSNSQGNQCCNETCFSLMVINHSGNFPHHDNPQILGHYIDLSRTYCLSSLHPHTFENNFISVFMIILIVSQNNCASQTHPLGETSLLTIVVYIHPSHFKIAIDYHEPW